jgi:hypothetical protein
MGLLKYLTASVAAAATAAVKMHLRGSGFSSSTVSDCNAGSLFHYDTGALNPPNPLPNTNTTLVLTFTNNHAPVNNGNIDFTVNLNGLPYSYTEPLCSQNLPCPIELGQHTIHSNPIDIGTITGKLVITANYKNDADESLLCVQTAMKLVSETDNKSKSFTVSLYEDY